MTSLRYVKDKVLKVYPSAFAIKVFCVLKRKQIWAVERATGRDRYRNIAYGRTRAEAWRNAAKGLK